MVRRHLLERVKELGRKRKLAKQCGDTCLKRKRKLARQCGDTCLKGLLS